MGYLGLTSGSHTWIDTKSFTHWAFSTGPLWNLCNQPPMSWDLGGLSPHITSRTLKGSSWCTFLRHRNCLVELFHPFENWSKYYCIFCSKFVLICNPESALTNRRKALSQLKNAPGLSLCTSASPLPQFSLWRVCSLSCLSYFSTDVKHVLLLFCSLFLCYYSCSFFSSTLFSSFTVLKKMLWNCGNL